MPDQITPEEQRLLARAHRMIDNGPWVQHLGEILHDRARGNGNELFNAALLGAVDAMLFDDQTDNQHHEPMYWGTHRGRTEFFRRHWDELRFEA